MVSSARLKWWITPPCIFVGLLAGVPCLSLAEESVQVFGLPLGGKLKNPVICPFNTDKSKVLCWIGKPFVSNNGDRFGTVHLPNPDSRPLWAAYASFDVSVAKTGELKSIRAKTFKSSDRTAIANSIASRFGLPDDTTLGQSVGHAIWSRSGVHIEVLCGSEQDICMATFRSPSAQAEHDEALTEARRKDKARPKSP